MRSTALPLAAIAVVLSFVACAAIQQQKQQTVRADQGEFKNLKVLPQTITHDELISTMRGFARALGVKCDHCHVRNAPGSKEEFDFPNDTKPEKNVARQMIRMVHDVNTHYIAPINPTAENVQCMTCHRGKRVPEIAAAEPPRGQQPTPPPPQP